MDKFLDTKLDELVKRAETPGQADDVRFSLTFSKRDNRRLEYIRRKLKMSKQELISDIVLAAISDIEVRLGLVQTSKTGHMVPQREYSDALNSSRPISSFFKDKE